MCGRYRTPRLADLVRQGIIDPPAFAEFSEKVRGLSLEPRYNVAPSQEVPVVRLDANDARALGLVKWGLIPSWTKEKPKIAPINARSETVATSRMFRVAFERRRCLVPVAGFYEWRKTGEAKQPFHIQMKGGEPFCFAGLWERWKPDEASEPVDTCTILTTEPNALMATLHDRMPVILKPADYDRWLDRRVLGVDVADLLAPYDADAMEAWAVSTKVGSPKNQGPELIERVDAA